MLGLSDETQKKHFQQLKLITKIPIVLKRSMYEIYIETTNTNKQKNASS